MRERVSWIIDKGLYHKIQILGKAITTKHGGDTMIPIEKEY